MEDTTTLVSDPNNRSFELGKYFLGQTTEEIRRLELQYRLLKKGFGHPDILDLPIDISKEGELKILDIAAGTGAWILDVARIPGISSRILSNSVTLSACDLSDAKFPPKAATTPLGIDFFVQDMTKPFAQELHGQFDLIHIGLVCFALTRQGWRSALKNVYDLLKPGGLFILMDYNLIFEITNQPVPKNELYDKSAYIQTESSIVNRGNSVMIYNAERNDFLWGLFVHIPEMLRSASLNLVSTKYFDLAYGAANSDQASGELSIINLGGFLGSVSKSSLYQDDLEIPRGHKISTEEEREQAMERLMRDIAKEGFTTGLAEWIAQKPLRI